MTIGLLNMTNLNPTFTGLKHYVWAGGCPRIKVVNEPGRLDPKNCFSVSISDEPSVVAGTSKIPEKQLKAIFAWVRTHDLLSAEAQGFSRGRKRFLSFLLIVKAFQCTCR